ncbi:MAG: heparinase II/III family protein, partial [Clostridia bacterium]|nr:heparinase II/III family protein [Clostridia bacterium]
VRNQAKEGYTSDGLWYECSMGYHYYATEALSEFLAIYHLRHPEDEMFELLHKAYTAPAALSPDGWTTPALNDGWYPTVFATYTRQIIYTHRYIPSEETGAQLRAIRERLPEKFENADALLFCQGDLSVYGAEQKRPDVCLFPGTCLAVMNKPTHVILKSGVLTTAHMHPDCMSISIAPFAEDIGTPGYGHPMTRTYYDQTICHNTFLMDGLSQPHRPVIGSVYEVAGGVEAHADNVYDGVSCTRTLTEKDGVLYDVMHIVADQKHQFDWVFRCEGTAQLPEGGAEAEFPGQHCSYERLTDIKLYEGAEAFEMKVELNGRKIIASICPETLKNVAVYTAVMPGNPADHPLTAILLRATSADLTIRASYRFE